MRKQVRQMEQVDTEAATQRWIAPNVGELKWNVDAAIWNDKNVLV